MARPDKSTKKDNPEARRTNILLEKLASEFRSFGEGVSDVRERVQKIEKRLDQSDNDMTNFVKPVLQSLRTVPNHLDNLSKQLDQLEGDVRELKKGLREKLETYDHRLSAAEAKLPA